MEHVHQEVHAASQALIEQPVLWAAVCEQGFAEFIAHEISAPIAHVECSHIHHGEIAFHKRLPNRVRHLGLAP